MEYAITYESMLTFFIFIILFLCETALLSLQRQAIDIDKNLFKEVIEYEYDEYIITREAFSERLRPSLDIFGTEDNYDN